MMRFFIFFGIFVGFQVLHAQSLQQAELFYTNFEYGKAAVLFDQVNRSHSLDFSDAKKLAYCYFSESDFNNGIPLLDSLANRYPEALIFLSWKAQLEKKAGNLNQAIADANNYRNHGGNIIPKNFIESCELNKTDSLILPGILVDSPKNNVFASYLIQAAGKQLLFMETGLDSLYNRISVEEMNSRFPECMVMRPFISEQNSWKEWSIFPDSLRALSVNSIQVDEQAKKAILGISVASSINYTEQLSHLFTADFNGWNQPLSNLERWSLMDNLDSAFTGQAALSESGNLLVFVRQQKDSQQADLWITGKTDGNWNQPELLTALNTAGNELFPVFSGDSLLRFSSDGRIGYGGLDLYEVKLDETGTVFGEIQLLKKPLNSLYDDFLLSGNKDSLYFTTNRPGGKGDDDVWLFLPEKPAPPAVEVVKMKKPPFDIQAFWDSCNSARLYFGFNQSQTPDIFKFIPKLSELKDSGYVFAIEITGFADSRGTAQANYLVGMKRARKVENDLINGGIQKDWLTCKSVGSTRLVNKCAYRVKCSEAEHSENRFVQLHITLISEPSTDR